MREFYQYLKVLKKDHDRSAVMATIIEVLGSSYRREGAKMLFLNNGAHYGHISGGCLEEDLKIHAKKVQSSQTSKMVAYDLQSEDDMGWGKGAGCNGEIKVLLEPIKWQSYHSKIIKELESGRDVVSLRGLTEASVQVRLFFTIEGKLIGSEQQVDVSIFKPYIQEFIRHNQIVKKAFVPEFCSTVFIERMESKEKLFIFGAGPDVEPIVKRAAEFDFLPVVIDPRESRCNAICFPDAALLVNEHPENFVTDYQMDLNSYVLIMTHSFTKDKQLVHYFSEHQPKYLGVLGPKKRTERLLYPKKVPEWFHSPIGIEIHAEGAEEISISILAELIKVRNHKRALDRKKKAMRSPAV